LTSPNRAISISPRGATESEAPEGLEANPPTQAK
jgi:hypothetical protein